MKNKIINFFGGIPKKKADMLEFKIKMLEDVLIKEMGKNKKIRSSFYYLCENLHKIGISKNEYQDIEIYKSNNKALGSLFAGLRWIVGRESSFNEENYDGLKFLIHKYIPAYNNMIQENKNILESKKYTECEELLLMMVDRVSDIEPLLIQVENMEQQQWASNNCSQIKKILVEFETGLKEDILRYAKKEILFSSKNNFNITVVSDEKLGVLIITQTERYNNSGLLEQAIEYFDCSIKNMRKKGYSFEYKIIEKGYSFEITGIKIK